MVAQTIALLRCMAKGHLIYHKMFTESAGSLATFLRKIEDAIRDERNAIDSKKHEWKHDMMTPHRTFSPRNTF